MICGIDMVVIRKSHNGFQVLIPEKNFNHITNEFESKKISRNNIKESLESIAILLGHPKIEAIDSPQRDIIKTLVAALKHCPKMSRGDMMKFIADKLKELNLE